MAEQLDPRLEGRLRAVLRAEADALPLTIRAAELERLAAERQRARSRQRLALLASAAVFAVAVGGLALVALPRPSVDVAASPSPSPDASASPAASPSPSAPIASPEPTPGEPSLPPDVAAGTLLARTTGAEAGSSTFTSPVPESARSLTLVIACSGTGTLGIDLGGVVGSASCEPTWLSSFVPPLGGTTTLRVTAEGSLRYVLELRAVTELGPTVKFTPPVATLAGPDRAVPGFAGCGLGFTLPNGDTASDQCGPSWMPIPDDRALRVASGAELTLTLPDGWIMTGLDGEITDHAGIEPAGRGPESAPLVQMDGGSPTVTFEAPQAGDWGVRLNINGQNTDGTRFGVPYYFRVVVTP